MSVQWGNMIPEESIGDSIIGFGSMSALAPVRIGQGRPTLSTTSGSKLYISDIGSSSRGHWCTKEEFSALHLLKLRGNLAECQRNLEPMILFPRFLM